MSDYSLLLVLILDLIICNEKNLPTVILYLQYSHYIVWFPTTCNDLTCISILIDIQHHEEIIHFKILQINPFPLKKMLLTLKTRIDWNYQFISTWDAAEVSFSGETYHFIYFFYLPLELTISVYWQHWDQWYLVLTLEKYSKKFIKLSLKYLSVQIMKNYCIHLRHDSKGSK